MTLPKKSYKKVATDKVTPKTRNEILKEMNSVLMSGTAKDGKLRPIFGAVDEVQLDNAGKEFKTGKQIYDVQIESIPVEKKEALEGVQSVIESNFSKINMVNKYLKLYESIKS